jgi:uracil-DNA glycosylase
VLLVGEAPGPRGADQSGIPFWGDRAGKIVYKSLSKAGLAEVPDEAWGAWDGKILKDRCLNPILKGAALGNAYPICPTKDGQTFRAPTDAELRAPENLARIRGDVDRAASLCPTRLRIIAMGKRALWLFGRLEGAPDFELHVLPHPSAQGLLQGAPNKGKGLHLADLEVAWRARLAELLNVS